MSDLMEALMLRLNEYTPNVMTMAGELAAVVAKHIPPQQLERTPDEWDTPGWSELSVALVAGGWTQLGCGHFAAVYEHKMYPGLAFKVGFKKEDSGAAYAAWCRANPSKHVPRILYLQRYAACYVCVMPKYTDLHYASAAVRSSFYSARRIIECGMPPCGASELEWVCSRIHAFFEGVADFDLHGDNAMVDADGTLVITDPVSFTRRE